ncbi:MAG TPA: hypothetical protein VNG69_15590, partial [Casimicrobiaceae bacterium]|nr:hypothetical protein [Casimicrobiaceae bacterium]
HVKLPHETLHYRVLEGRARFADGDLTEVVLVNERIGRDGHGDETDLLIITPVTLPGGSDCLIYDFLGPNVSFETPNVIRFVNHR